jgi:hypothetical protein
MARYILMYHPILWRDSISRPKVAVSSVNAETILPGALFIKATRARPGIEPRILWCLFTCVIHHKATAET